VYTGFEVAGFPGGDRRALATLFEQHRERLRRMLDLPLDPRSRSRLDASDVSQDSFRDVAHEHNHVR
jgi:RNA polymerase sigma-70 factor (ECF subfamily)